MVCSQFVDHVLKTAGIDITNKSSNLVSPKMLSEVDPNSTNIYMMYKGTLEDYKPKNVDKQVKYLLKTVLELLLQHIKHIRQIIKILKT